MTEPTTIFIRLLADEDKAAALAQSITASRDGQPAPNVYAVSPESFAQVPGSPFAYWVSDRVTQLYSSLPALESSDRVIRVGLQTNYDFRWLRLAWEIPSSTINCSWFYYSKGGEYSKFYSGSHLVVEWSDNGREIKEWKLQELALRRITANNSKCWNEGKYFQEGLTWSRRSQRGLSVRVHSKGNIFADKGPVIFVPEQLLMPLLGLTNSTIFHALVTLQMAFGSYEVGVIQRTPVPNLSNESGKILSAIANSSFTLKRDLDATNEESIAFRVPVLLQVPNETLTACFSEWQARVVSANQQLAACQREIDDIAFKLYGIDGADRAAIEASLGTVVAPAVDQEVEAEADDEEESAANADARGEVANLVSYLVGCVMGRWDIRYATGERQPPTLPDPFAPLPACSPGMLIGEDGLPLSETPPGYPLRIDWDGVLVDDANHNDDIMQRVRDALGVIWGERAEAIEREACEILGVKELREYFRASGKGGFWLDHVSRYSKSRRKAPIYWLMQSSKKNYGIWLYYHRVDKDTYYKVLVNYVEPKIRLEESHMLTLRTQRTTAGTGGSAVKQLDKTLERQEAFVSELHDFADKLRRAADLHLDPDLNDGVVLNIAPLWELVPWSEAKKYWDELKAGKYEWSSIGKQLREKGIIKG